MIRVVKNFRSAIVVVTAVVLVTIALLFGFFRLLLPLTPALQEKIQKEASLAFGVPVVIGSMDTQWRGLGPELEFHDVELRSNDNAEDVLLSFTEMRVGLNIFDLLSGNGLQPRRLELAGLQLVVEKRLGAGFFVRGLSGESRRRGDFVVGLMENLSRSTELELLNTQVFWVRETALGLTEPLPSLFDVRLSSDGEVLYASLVGTPPKDIGEALRLTIESSGDFRDLDAIESTLSMQATGLEAASPWLNDLLPLARYVTGGQVDLNIDMEWEGLRLLSSSGNFDADNMLGANSSIDGEYSLQGDFAWRPTADGWTFVAEPVRAGVDGEQWPLTAMHVQASTKASLDDETNSVAEQQSDTASNAAVANQAAGKSGVAIQQLPKATDFNIWFESLRIGKVANLAEAFWPEAPKPIATLLAGQPSGLVHDLQLVVQRQPAAGRPKFSVLSSSGRLEDFGLTASATLPGLSGVNAAWRQRGSAGSLFIRADSAALTIPKAYTEALQLETVQVDINIERSGRRTRLKSEQLSLQLNGIDVQSEFELLLEAEQPPALELTAALNGVTVSKFKPLLPKLVPERAREWLQSSFLSGNLENVRLGMTGDPRRFPFADGGGELNVALDVSKLNVEFHEDWPQLRNISGPFRIHNVQLLSDDLDAEVATGGTMRGGKLLVDNLYSGSLQLTGAFRSSVPQTLRFMRESPLNEAIGPVFAGVTGRGPLLSQLNINVPIADPEAASVKGQAKLNNVVLSRNDMERITDVQGQLNFYRNTAAAGANGQGVEGKVWGLPFTASLEVRDGEPNVPILAEGVIDLDAEDGAGREFIETVTPLVLADALSGSLRWQADLSGTAEQDAGSKIKLRSNLLGLQRDFPAPYTASADQPSDFSLVIDRSHPGGMQVNLDYGQQSDHPVSGVYWLQRSDDGWLSKRGTTVIGGSDAALRTESGMNVAIALAEFDYDTAMSWLLTQSAKRPAEETDHFETSVPEDLENISFNVAKMHAAGLDWHDVQAELNRVRAERGDGYEMTLQSDLASGSAYLPLRSDAKPMQLRLQRLYLPKLADFGPMFDVSGGSEVAVVDEPINPFTLPGLDVVVDDFRYKDIRFGRLDVQARHGLYGLRFQQIETKGGQVDIQATARWDMLDGLHSSELLLDASTKEIKNVLEKLDFEGTVGAQQANMSLRLAWPSSLDNMQAAEIYGQLSMRMRDGVIYSVDPGPGKVLGLLSFYTIPRRLALNFKDIVEAGLSFDTLDGDYTISDGNAYSKNTVIDGPGVHIELAGRTGFVARDYDQQVTVSADVSSGVVLAAAALQGLGVGVVLLVVQELLDRPLSKLGQLHYRLQGSWDDPSIETDGQDPARLEPKALPEDVLNQRFAPGPRR